MSKLGFFRNFLSRPIATGAVAPSSRRLADLITSTVNLSESRVVVELGPGTGVFTESILAKIGPQTKFFAVELSPSFAAATRRRCPGVTVHEGSALDLRRFLDIEQAESADHIISSLPWANISFELQDSLLDCIHKSLSPTGELVTFAYLTGMMLPAGKRLREKLTQKFRLLDTTRTIWRNLPPAFIYHARK